MYILNLFIYLFLYIIYTYVYISIYIILPSILMTCAYHYCFADVNVPVNKVAASAVYTSTQVGENLMAFSNQSRDNSQTLEQYLHQLPTVKQSGVDTNGSTQSCAFLSIYGLGATRAKCCENFSKCYFTQEIVRDAEAALTSTFCYEELTSDHALYPLWKSWKTRKQTKQNEIKNVSRNMISSIMPFLSYEQKTHRNGEAHILSCFSDVVESMSCEIQAKKNLLELAQQYQILQEELSNVPLFPDASTRSEDCKLAYITLLNQDGYACSDEDLNIISHLHGLTLVRVNKNQDNSARSGFEPILAFNPMDRLDNGKIADIIFIAYKSNHYERIPVINLERNHMDELRRISTFDLYCDENSGINSVQQEFQQNFSCEKANSSFDVPVIETLNFEHSEILANVQQESQMYHGM